MGCYRAASGYGGGRQPRRAKISRRSAEEEPKKAKCIPSNSSKRLSWRGAFSRRKRRIFLTRKNVPNSESIFPSTLALHFALQASLTVSRDFDTIFRRGPPSKTPISRHLFRFTRRVESYLYFDTNFRHAQCPELMSSIQR